MIDYDTSTRSSTIQFYTNLSTETYSVKNFIHEQFQSVFLIGQKYEYTTELESSSFFHGYIYKLEIHNVAEDETFVGAQIDDSCAQYGATSCEFCPAADPSTCISDCPVNQYDDPCNTCHEDCDGNCVRQGNDCSLCDNLLCIQCTAFDANTCLECKENTIPLEESNGDCICDGNHVLKTPEYICTCSDE